MPCLTLLGTASIQEYIFRSNRLRENLGASELVRDAMGYWRDSPAKIYIGGGNAALRFGSEELAKQAINAWSWQKLREAPGLRLVAAHHNYEEGRLADEFDKAQEKLFKAENAPPLGAELGALPIVRRCPSTGMAASERAVPVAPSDEDQDIVEDNEDDDQFKAGPVWLSAEAQAKRSHYWRFTRKRLTRDYGETLQKRYLFPRDLGRLGTVEGASQIALVHADGNSIGAQFQQLIEEQRGNDAILLAKLRQLSDDITEVSMAAFKRLLRDLIEQIPGLEEKDVVTPKRHSKSGRFYLPLRPIVDDGDDLTFVCHGRLGISLAARYLELFAEESRNRNRKFTASAGVLIMPQKFPFAQGYSMVEELCAKAKKKRRETNPQSAWMDFHVLLEGRAGTLDKIRERYPIWKKVPVYTRPYSLNGDWTTFGQAFETVKSWPRWKAKQILQSYPSGQDVVKKRLEQWARDCDLPAPLTERDVFDALEMLDFYHPIDWSRNGATQD